MCTQLANHRFICIIVIVVTLKERIFLCVQVIIIGVFLPEWGRKRPFFAGRRFNLKIQLSVKASFSFSSSSSKWSSVVFTFLSKCCYMFHRKTKANCTTNTSSDLHIYFCSVQVWKWSKILNNQKGSILAMIASFFSLVFYCLPSHCTISSFIPFHWSKTVRSRKSIDLNLILITFRDFTFYTLYALHSSSPLFCLQIQSTAFWRRNCNSRGNPPIIYTHYQHTHRGKSAQLNFINRITHLAKVYTAEESTIF